MSEYSPHLHLIPGVSASGKTTAARYATQRLNEAGIRAEHVIAHTTRPPRQHEQQGVDYHFLTDQEFQENHPISNEDTWRYSKIGDAYYFNSDTATLPNPSTPVKLLPVAFSEVETILDDYSSHESLRITVVPLIIAPEIKTRWLASVQIERPDRDLEQELRKQDDALRALSDYIDDVFAPRWNSREDDLKAYYRKIARSIMYR